MPQREQLLQLARLTGSDAFAKRFGAPQTAQPAPDALRAFVDERLDELARHLVEEAAASDDVTDVVSAESYLDDRLTVLNELLTAEQADAIRETFRERIAGW